MCTRTVPVRGGLQAIVSAEDYDRVVQCRWALWGKYPWSKQAESKLHNFVFGARPEGVADTYVLDHIDRNPLNATRSNLRWVSPSFNVWNRTYSNSRSITNPYIGVTFQPRTGRWQAKIRCCQIGTFDDAKEAFISYARAAVKEWPLWAPTSDLLVGEGLLSVSEMQQIQQSQPEPEPVKQDKHAYIHHRNGHYEVYWPGKRRPSRRFATLAQAIDARNNAVLTDREYRWAAHRRLSVPLNSDGQAVILLCGRMDQDLVALVPAELYHIITFGSSWCLDADGYVVGQWGGKMRKLHAVVYRLLNPCYVPGQKGSIDHVNNNKLDNTESNLIPATPLQQARNKRKRSGTSSQHIGVCKLNTGYWQARFCYAGRTYRVGAFVTEQKAFEALTLKKQQVIKDC